MIEIDGLFVSSSTVSTTGLVYHSCPLFSKISLGSELIKKQPTTLHPTKTPNSNVRTVGSRLLAAQPLFCLCISLAFGRSNINFKIIWPGSVLDPWDLTLWINTNQTGTGLATTESLSTFNISGSNFWYCLTKVTQAIIQIIEQLPFFFFLLRLGLLIFCFTTAFSVNLCKTSKWGGGWGWW